MIKELGFEKNLISVEKELSSLPDITKKTPKRRLDILCYTNTKEGLKPLLMVECKAIKLDHKALEQVAGYNHFVGAYFMAIANEKEFVLFWKNSSGKFEKIDFLPNYLQLVSSIF